ncbi:MAG: FAD-binding protein [Actinobacteria bacterium]|nr:FAD-binding protein [Actinomycetota bacterium]
MAESQQGGPLDDIEPRLMLGAGSQDTMVTTIRNWDRTLTWRPTTVHRPADADEVSRIVAVAAEQGRRVKPVGSSLSWSDVADIPDQVLQLDNLNSVSVDGMLARVGAGAKLRDVNESLAAHGLSLENFGSITMQTLGGYIGTGTHGTGGRTPILSSFIEELELVDGLGRIRTLNRESEPELFSAARVNLGALGVITAVSLRCVPSFDLEERLELIDFDTALADLDAYVDGNDYCKLWWMPYSDKLQVYTFNRTDKPRTPFTMQERFDASGLSGRVFTGILELSRRRPNLTPRLFPAVERRTFRDHVRVDRSDRIIRYAGTIPKHQETEYAIPREQAAEAIEGMRRLVLSASAYKVNFTQEVRFVAADDIAMSPASGRDSCYLGGYTSNLRTAPAYFLDFEQLMAQYRGRPHWGKSFNRDARQIRDLYPRYDEFARLRQQSDPQGVFGNRLLERIFAPVT